jgi:hypothetical protein
VQDQSARDACAPIWLWSLAILGGIGVALAIGAVAICIGCRARDEGEWRMQTPDRPRIGSVSLVTGKDTAHGFALCVVPAGLGLYVGMSIVPLAACFAVAMCIWSLVILSTATRKLPRKRAGGRLELGRPFLLIIEIIGHGPQGEFEIIPKAPLATPPPCHWTARPLFLRRARAPQARASRRSARPTRTCGTGSGPSPDTHQNLQPRSLDQDS